MTLAFRAFILAVTDPKFGTGPTFLHPDLPNKLPHVILGLKEPGAGVKEVVVAVLVHHPRRLCN